MKNRRTSRELALQALYAWDQGDDCDVDKLIEYLIAESGYEAEAGEYARELVHKTIAAKDSIDIRVQKHAANWDIKRMAVIDRNILRMAIAELTQCEGVPFKVVIDEAVELAKIYGTDDSSKFVNGVIDSCYKELAPPHKNRPQKKQSE